ncbi:MAG: hypothetical protein ABI564_18120, partial [Ideonella sp.]
MPDSRQTEPDPDPDPDRDHPPNFPMTDEYQIDIPPSFIALYIDPGRTRPNASRQVIAARYEFCEDLATMLTDHARTMLFDLGVTEHDVLERCHRGLMV